MPSVREFFSTEASEYLDKLGNLVAGLNDSAVDPAELHKVTRALRGSAQMAREERIYKVAVGLEDHVGELLFDQVGDDAFQQACVGGHLRQDSWDRYLHQLPGPVGDDRPDMVESDTEDLVEIYRALGKTAEAESCHARAFAILERAIGPDLPELSESLSNSAILGPEEPR